MPAAALGHDIEIHADNEGLHDFFAIVRGGADGLGRLGTAAPGRELIAGSGCPWCGDLHRVPQEGLREAAH